MNPLLLDTGSPPIPEAQGWLAGYDGRLGPAINLSQAVPGTPPHPGLLERMAAAAADPACSGYGPILGDALLRERYAAHLSTVYAARIEPADVAITTGCNQAFFVTLLALARAGDNILLPAPWYFNQQMACTMLGVEPRALLCSPGAGLVPDAAEAEALIDGRTRAIVLVTPNNPTGAVYPPATIAAFADLAERRGVTLLLDETYRDFLPFGSARPHAVFDGPWRGRVLQLYSFSKAYCMPGARLGAIAAGAEMLGEIAKVLDTVQICPPRVAQGAAAWGLEALADWRAANTCEIARRADAFEAALAGARGWRIEAIGAYFAYVRHPFDAPAALVAQRLARENGVLALPGPYFGPGQEPFLRVAFANVDASALRAAGERLALLDTAELAA